MATKTMIHKGKQTITVPAKRELREVPDPDGAEGEVKLEEVELEPETQQTIDLSAGTRFGPYSIKTPYEISDPDVQKSLLARGFEPVSKEQAKKLDAKAEKADATSTEGLNARAAEHDRVRAIVNQASFEPSRGIKGEQLKEAKATIKEKGGEK